MGDDGPAGNARSGGSISVGTSALPEVLDPALATDPVALQALWSVYTPLLTYRHAEGAEGTELVPGLARELPEVSEDGTTYEFALRRGLFYSNGSPLRASDFERALRRARRMASPYAGLYTGIGSIQADDRAGLVTVTLNQPDATFAHVVALPASAPVPAGTPSEDLSRDPPPGIGPYEIVGVRPEERWRLRRVRGFNLADLPAGRVDVVTVDRYDGVVSQTQAASQGTLDLMQELPSTEQLPEIRSRYDDRYDEQPSASTVFLEMDTTVPPLDDGRVRQAVSLAVDGPTLERLYNGLLEPGCTLLPLTVAGQDAPDPCPYGERSDPPDLLRARELVVEAGLSATRVTVVAARDETPPAAPRYLARTLRKLGLAAEVELVADSDAIAATPSAAIAFTALTPELVHPASYLRRFGGRTGDSELDASLQRLLAEPALNEARDAWAALDARVVEEAYAAPLGTKRLPMFFSERMDVQGCPASHPIFGTDFARLCLK